MFKTNKKEMTIESHCTALTRFLQSISTMPDFNNLLRVILTPAEIESISQRLMILDHLACGIPQREIAETLEVGIATVTRGSRAWQEASTMLKQHFPRKPLDNPAMTE